MPQQLNDPEYRARAYPYFVPDKSYVMDNGAFRLIEHDNHIQDIDGRRPVLAVGSNMSPQQLGRKFPGPDGGYIPVTRVHLHNFDSVYSTHFTRYGAIPSTLFHSPGTVVTLFINWLDPEQEERMHATEIASENYKFCRLDALKMDVENAPDLDHLYLYLSSRGALAKDGMPVPMLEAPARDRQWSPMGQIEIQDHARKELAPEQSFDLFASENMTNEVVRRSRTDALHVNAMPFTYEHLSVVAS